MKWACLWLIALLSLSAFAGGTDAHAQSITQVEARVDREWSRAGERRRDALAAAQCRQAIAERQSNWASSWCGKAYQRAFHFHGEDYVLTRADRDALFDAAWVAAVDGIGYSAAGYHLRETASVSPDPTGDAIRAWAFDSFAALRHNRCPDTNIYADLARSLDVPAGQGEQLAQQRLSLLDQALAMDLDADRLWLVTIIIATARCEFGTGPDIPAHLDALASRLQTLDIEAVRLAEQDAVLSPLFHLALGELHAARGDFVRALPLFSEGDASCATRIWANADICLQLGLLAARAQYLVAHPDYLTRPLPALVEGQRETSTDSPLAYCRGLWLADIGADGRLENRRILFERPSGECRDQARRYLDALRYAAPSPDERSRDLLVGFILRPD